MAPSLLWGILACVPQEVHWISMRVEALRAGRLAGGIGVGECARGGRSGRARAGTDHRGVKATEGLVPWQRAYRDAVPPIRRFSQTLAWG